MKTLWPIGLLLMEITAGLASFSGEGKCALSGSCGKKSLFGNKLPCPDDRLAEKLSQKDEGYYDILAEVCGEEWRDSKVCCTPEDIDVLRANLKQAEPLISSCPACHKNFKQIFCQFTCSPDQASFLDVTKTQNSIDGKKIVAEVEYSMNSGMASDVFDSCKGIKFSATNGYAMDLIGGGAKNYTEFLKFLGDEKPMLGGSPFQINFKYSNDTNDSKYLNKKVYPCNGPEYNCACSDCEEICPELSPIDQSVCTVGVLPCFSFTVIVVYLGLLIAVVSTYYYKLKSKRIQLLQESPYLRSTDLDNLPENLGLMNSKNEVYLLNTILENWFSKLAFYCASYPATVLTITLVVTSSLSSCIYFFGQLEKNPVNLWVSSSADAYKQKQNFESHFGEFYRTEQIFIVNEKGVLTDEIVNWWGQTEQDIRALKVNNTSLEDLCFRPTEDSTCIVESFTEYFNGNIPKDWSKKLKDCTDTPVNCLPSFQQPLNKELLFGGYDENDVLSSKAIVVTFLLNNNQNTSDIATGWENSLRDYLLNVTLPKDTRISFNTEPSLEFELNKSSNTDAKIVIISYLVMFFYASFSLGGSFKLTKTRFSVGLSGILIVLLSVTASAGFFSLLGVKSTLIIAEVIPFLILAVGVDNIFLITHELKLINYSYPNESIPFRVSKAVGRMGPSILLSSTSQFLTFSIASVIAMPAVKNFAMYSAGAVLFNSILQMTAFISILSLDQLRIDNDRLDFFPCIRIPKKQSIRLDDINELFENEIENDFFDKIISFYGPIILKHKKQVILTFLTITSISLSLIPGIQLGLDQTNALPKDSYLVDYFNDFAEYFNVGPPVYFVVENLNVTDLENQKKICGKFTSCNEYSLSNVLEQERKRPEVSTIASPVSSWLDDYLLFLNPDLDECCRLKKNVFNDTVACAPHAPPRQCTACFANKPWDYSMTGFPEGEEFNTFFDIWINSPSDPCPLGGKAPYSNAIDMRNGEIVASHFRTMHTPLRTQDDFIKAYEESLRITKELQTSLDYQDIYAYSPFYIFFIQYQTIFKLTFSLITLSLVVILCNSTILLGSIKSALAMVITVIMILINIAGVMSLWKISLNAVSLVNLIICIGLAVEFCVHITRSFVISDKDSRLNNVEFRAFNSLTSIGSSVLGGIATTKLIGVIVLAFTNSKIFEIYYFRMWLSLVLIASLHALVFLPVLLSVFGGKRYIYSENSTGIADDIANRLSEI